jgi:hypothetical protein
VTTIMMPMVMANSLPALREIARAWGVSEYDIQRLKAPMLKGRIIAAYLRACDADHAEELRRRLAA